MNNTFELIKLGIVQTINELIGIIWPIVAVILLVLAICATIIPAIIVFVLNELAKRMINKEKAAKIDRVNASIIIMLLSELYALTLLLSFNINCEAEHN